MAALVLRNTHFRTAFDDEVREPEILPVLFPILLANGAPRIPFHTAPTLPLRIVLEPRARTVDDALLEESLYRLTDLEVRFALNLNVLDENRTPVVMSLKEALAAWLKFQIHVLVRKSEVRVAKIDDRMELLHGFLIAFLNLDRVIAIIRSEDEPKPVLIAEFSLTDRQAEAILNMRLRSLRKL